MAYQEDPHERERIDLRSELHKQKEIVQRLYATIVRGMVVIKYIIRIGACVATWFYVGHMETYYLAGFIVLTSLFQLVIDKTRKIVHPELKLSEWNLL